MFDSEKALNTLLYVIKALGPTGFHKAFKVMYFAEREHLALYGLPLTSDRFISMDNGPVPSVIFDILKALRNGHITNENEHLFSKSLSVIGNHCLSSEKEPNLDFLSETEVEALDKAIEFCRNKDFSELTNLSHDRAWELAQPNKPMSTLDIARSGGADETMVSYIRSFIENESMLSGCPF